MDDDFFNFVQDEEEEPKEEPKQKAAGGGKKDDKPAASDAKASGPVALNTNIAAGNDELACSYAALILHDAGVTVNAEAITKIIKAAGVTIKPFWPKLFERALAGRDINDIIFSSGGGGGGGAVAPASAGGSGGGAAPSGGSDTTEEKQPEKEESEGLEFDLFA